MRDPKRIKQILDLIEKIWKKNPDLRLNQLIYNIVSTSRPVASSDLNHYTLYSLEDDEFKALLELYINNNL